MVPVLFVIEIPYERGLGKVYLHDKKHSIFNDEQEYLLAGIPFKVKDIEKKEETHEDYGSKMVTVIYLGN